MRGGSSVRYAQHDGAAPTYYKASARGRRAWPVLDGNRRADVCSDGYAGLSAALHLAERGFRVMLPEARRRAAAPAIPMPRGSTWTRSRERR